MINGERLAARDAVACVLLLALAPAACTSAAADPGEEVRSRQNPVVYGEDDRTEPFAYPDAEWAEAAARFSVALIGEDAVDLSDPGRVRLSGATLAESGLCGDERFAAQPIAAFCSGTLIAPDLVLTAGHCVASASDCAATRFVFGYAMAGPDRLASVTVADVFECAELVAQKVHGALDLAVVRLDRPAGRQPATVADDLAALPAGAPLVAHGFPLGLPLKLDDGGAVRDGGEAPLTSFVAELDTFAGSSGSGVFDAATRELVGIATAGERDLEHDAGAGCDRVRVCPHRGGGGERVVYAARAVQALCAAAADPVLCRCGDGTCDGAGGEASATCAADCGDACGDGACNGVETSSACPEDCGEPAAAPPGDTCEGAIDLSAGDTTQVIEGTTLDHADDHSASCGGGSADRVYRITVAEPSHVEVTAAGYDTVLYLRADCADPATELACNDDVEAGEAASSISADVVPGTYYLFVDGYACEAGPFTLRAAIAPADCGEHDAECSGCSVEGTGNPSLLLGMLVAWVAALWRRRGGRSNPKARFG